MGEEPDTVVTPQAQEEAERLGIAIGVCFGRANTFDTMINGTNAGRQPQPLGGVDGDRRIEDDCGRDDQGMAKQFLGFGSLVSDARDAAKIAARECRWDADLAHGRWLAGWRADRAVGVFDRTKLVEVIGTADAVRKAQLNCLGGISDRSSADVEDGLPYPGRDRGGLHWRACARAPGGQTIGGTGRVIAFERVSSYTCD